MSAYSEIFVPEFNYKTFKKAKAAMWADYSMATKMGAGVFSYNNIEGKKRYAWWYTHGGNKSTNAFMNDIKNVELAIPVVPSNLGTLENFPTTNSISRIWLYRDNGETLYPPKIKNIGKTKEVTKKRLEDVLDDYFKKKVKS